MMNTWTNCSRVPVTNGRYTTLQLHHATDTCCPTTTFILHKNYKKGSIQSSHVLALNVKYPLSLRPLSKQQIGQKSPQPPLRKPDLVFSIRAYKETHIAQIN